MSSLRPPHVNARNESSLSRRSLIGHGAGVVAAAHIGATSVRAASYPPLVATVVLNGQTFVYREDQGQDLGDFDSDIGKFKQGCVKSVVQGSPLVVFFRPDRSSDRAEVVFELGRLFSGKPENLTSYQVTISRDNQTLATLDVPAHYWFSRWRWQSAPRPIVGNIDDLISRGLLPLYDRSRVPAASSTQVAAAKESSTAVEAAAAATGSTTLVVGTTLTDRVIDLTRKDYLIPVQAGVTYTLAVGGNGFGSVLVTIQDADDNWVAMNFDGSGFTGDVGFVAASSSTYRASVQSLTGTPVDFTLTLGGPAVVTDPTPTPVTPPTPTPTTPPPSVEPPPYVDDFAGDASSTGTLAVGGSASGLIGIGGDRDDFKLTLNATTTYRIICASGSLLLPVLTVRDATGATVARSAFNGSVPVFLNFKPAANGTYWLAVENNGSGTGTYTVTLADTAQAAPVYTIMGLAGVTAYMPSTGERNDIGLVTGPQGDFICTEAPSALGIVRAQAEAAGTVPWHMRDENTNAPINFNSYPNATWYEINRGWTPYIVTTQTPVTVDAAHQPALAYLPYLLTGDPYHLEDLQFQANWNWGSLPPGFRPSVGQSRTLAWTLRTLSQSAKMSPKSVPSWLLPQSYWEQMLETYGSYLEQNYINNMSTPRARFRSTSDIDNNRSELPSGPPGGTWIDPWQEEFLLAVVGWMISMGYLQWRPFFDWKALSTIIRTHKNSGWNRAYATPYRMMLRRDRDLPYVESWGEAYALSERSLNYRVTSDDTWVEADMTYLQYTLGALVYIKRRNAADVSENLAWAVKQFELKPSWKIPNKWRLRTDI